MKKHSIAVIILMVMAVLATSCNVAPPAAPTPAPTPGDSTPVPVPGTPAPSPATPQSTGTIEVRVTDAPPKYGVEEVNVTFSEVAVHKAADGEDGEGEWITIPIVDGSFDLVELKKQDLEGLLASSDNVSAGKYTQLRVIVDTVEVTYTLTPISQ